MVVTPICTWSEVGITAVISIAFTPSVGETPLSLRKKPMKKKQHGFSLTMLRFLSVFLCSGVSITRWWQPLWNLRSCGLLQSCVLPVPFLFENDGMLVTIKTPALRIIGPSYRQVWICIAGFWDLQTTSFEIPWFLGWANFPNLLIQDVTFLGWWKTWPFQGLNWPPTRGWKGHGLNHLEMVV